jgi:hypothetical protein
MQAETTLIVEYQQNYELAFTVRTCPRLLSKLDQRIEPLKEDRCRKLEVP